MEKSRELQRDMNIAFADSSKAYDTGNQEILDKILAKLGCPVKSISITEKLNTDILARIIFHGDIKDPLGSMVVLNKVANWLPY